MSNTEKPRLEFQVWNSFYPLIFRRVSRLVTCPSDHIKTLYFHSDKKSVVIPDNTFHRFTKQEEHQNVEYLYKKFGFYTSAKTLRENDEYEGTSFYCTSETYGLLDIVEGATFEFRRKKTSVLPRVGDLICGLPDVNHEGRFAYWFCCSEQFLHAWTAIIMVDHSSFGDRDEFTLRRQLMSGNRICTATYRKWLLSNKPREPTRQDHKDRYYRLRTEPCSVKWVHVYAALVLLLRYHEFPTLENVPQNVPGTTEESLYTIGDWDLPNGWIKRLASKYVLCE